MPAYPVILADLTPRMRAAICNGCGAQAGWLSRIRPPQGHARVHCDQHDLESWLGGSTWQRLGSAVALTHGLLGAASAQRWWIRPAWRMQAIAYGLAVFIGGARTWHHGRPRTWDDLRALDPFAPSVPPWFSSPGIGSAHDPEYGWH